MYTTLTFIIVWERAMASLRVSQCLAALAICVMCLGTSVSAAVVGPYSVDTNTMHLWHLDEQAAPAADQAHYNYAGTFTTKPDSNTSLTAPFGTAALGAAGFTGFGTSLSNGATPNTAGLAGLPKVDGTGDNVDHTFDHPTTHAFTMEAMIRIGFDPTVALATPQEIIAGEGDAGDSSDRSWQFRIEGNATPGTTAWRLRFQKVSGFGAPGGSTANFNLDGNIPSTGINAIEQNGWYHVAATFNGDFANPDNLKLYWTKVDDANTAAALLAMGQMNGWLRQQDTDFALGNELRDFNGNTEGFVGSIDEVRISDIARTADQFIFAVPEPSSFVIAALGIVGLVGAACRRK
jgi:hypothetical protein